MRNCGFGVLADTLKYLYLGQRARAESQLQQRQPGLIERLVQQQISSTVWNEDFGRMLFQLMVPHDFKDLARQLEQVVLVVDETTANLPWELMAADDPDRGGEAAVVHEAVAVRARHAGVDLGHHEARRIDRGPRAVDRRAR